MCLIQATGLVRKTIVCLDQADAYKWMAHKKVPGFIDKAVETLERKNQGDLTLIDEVAEAHVNPTSAQKLMQAGSSEVAKLPENIAFVNPAVNAAGADGMVKLLEFMKEQREADEKREEKRRQAEEEREEKKRQAEEEREEKKRQADKEERQEREKFMAKLMAEQREADEKREQKQREKDKEMAELQAEQQNKRDDKQNSFLLAMVDTLKEDRDNKRAAANDGKSQAEPEEPDQKRLKLTSHLLGFEAMKQEAKDWLYQNIGKFVKPVHLKTKQADRSFALITLQKALHKHSTFNMLCDGRIVRCTCLHKCIQRVYPDINFKHMKQADDSVRIGCIGLSLDIKALAKVQ